MKGSNPIDKPEIGSVSTSKKENVKKVPNGPLQGLVPGEIGFFDFPFRLKKSRR